MRQVSQMENILFNDNKHLFPIMVQNILMALNLSLIIRITFQCSCFKPLNYLPLKQLKFVEIFCIIIYHVNFQIEYNIKVQKLTCPGGQCSSD